MPRLSEDDPRIIEAKRLYKNGASKKAIAEKFGVAPRTIYSWLDPEFLEKRREESRRFKRSIVGKCIDCGGETHYAGKKGTGSIPSLRCSKCSVIRSRGRRPEYAGKIGHPKAIQDYLAEHGPSYFAVIRDHFGITSGHMGVLLHRCMKYGYIVRVSRGLYALPSHDVEIIENPVVQIKWGSNPDGTRKLIER